MSDATQTTRTAPGTPTARRTVPTTATEPTTRPTATALSAPRLALMAQPQRRSPKRETPTSIFAQWAAADRIDGRGKSLIREIEGTPPNRCPGCTACGYPQGPGRGCTGS